MRRKGEEETRETARGSVRWKEARARDRERERENNVRTCVCVCVSRATRARGGTRKRSAMGEAARERERERESRRTRDVDRAATGNPSAAEHSSPLGGRALPDCRREVAEVWPRS